MAKSIIQEDRDNCFICGRHRNAEYFGLDEHHIFSGAYRNKSEQYGLKIYICHDRCHLNGVHKNAKLNNAVKAKAQQIAMDHYGWDTEEFIKIFGKNYI